jgi:pentatricopeptide repeat protein
LTPLLFALVDAVLWAEARGLYGHARVARGYCRRQMPDRMKEWHELMQHEKRHMGEWRSLWGVL